MDAAIEKSLKELCSVFLKENAAINLSAFRTEEACWVGNILDSLAFQDLELPPSPPTSALASLGSTVGKPAPSLKILDLGTGGGFPLLPLAIVNPEYKFTGMDATTKKIEAVKRIADAMHLTNIELIVGRAEDAGHDPKLREQFDVVLSRGVAEIATLLEYCAPFVKPKGHIVLWKSLHIAEELKNSMLARAELSSHLIKEHAYELPGNFGKRQLLVFEKASKLSGKYPRGNGEPKKNPLH